jgi:hypothetical protein
MWKILCFVAPSKKAGSGLCIERMKRGVLGFLFLWGLMMHLKEITVPEVLMIIVEIPIYQMPLSRGVGFKTKMNT